VVGQFVIRAGVESDIDTIRSVEVQAGRLFADIGMQSIASDEPPGFDDLAVGCADDSLWVAVDADQGVVGYAKASVVDGHGHLDQVSVVPEFGRRGIGRALIEHVLKWAASGGYAEVTLTTFRDVAWNGPYYERLGFREIDEESFGLQVRPELAELRRLEIANGLDVEPRVAMSISTIT